MKKSILSIILFFIFLSTYAQQPIHVTWDDLAKIKWVTVYNATRDVYYDIPKHSSSIKKLKNKEITIQGFYVPVDPLGNVFALSAGPSSMCFFCNVGGIETVMEIVVKKGNNDLKRVKTDKYIEIKGKFKLNMKEDDHLMYILEDAELVRIIK